ALGAVKAEGRPPPPPARGGVFDPPLAQLVRSGLARLGLANDAAAPIVITPLGHSQVEARVGGELYRVGLKSAEVEFYGSCSALHTGKPSRGRRMVFDGAEQLRDR